MVTSITNSSLRATSLRRRGMNLVEYVSSERYTAFPSGKGKFQTIKYTKQAGY